MYVYTHLCACTYALYVCTYVCVYVCMFVCVCMYACICMHVCMHVCMHGRCASSVLRLVFGVQGAVSASAPWRRRHSTPNQTQRTHTHTHTHTHTAPRLQQLRRAGARARRARTRSRRGTLSRNLSSSSSSSLDEMSMLPPAEPVSRLPGLRSSPGLTSESKKKYGNVPKQTLFRKPLLGQSDLKIGLFYSSPS